MAINMIPPEETRPAPPSSDGALGSATDAARELANRIVSLPHTSVEAQHPSYGVVRALAFTIIDMLEAIARETRDGASSQPHSGNRISTSSSRLRGR